MAPKYGHDLIFGTCEYDKGGFVCVIKLRILEVMEWSWIIQ